MSKSDSGLDAIAILDIVGRRSEQQDSAKATLVTLAEGKSVPLLVVADGMGGAIGGSIASNHAIAAFCASMEKSGGLIKDRLQRALDAANAAIAAKVASDPQLKGMGCTLIGAVLDGDRLEWISVGDSLLMVVDEGRIARLNQDHSLAPQLDEAVQRGEMTAQDAANDPQRHVLLAALTGGTIRKIDLGAKRVPAGSAVILSTDGVLTLTFPQIVRTVKGIRDPARMAQAIVSAVERDMPDDQDNLTLVIARVGGAGRRRWLPSPFKPRNKTMNPARRILPLVLSLLAVCLGILLLAAVVLLLIQRPVKPVPPKPVAHPSGPVSDGMANPEASEAIRNYQDKPTGPTAQIAGPAAAKSPTTSVPTTKAVDQTAPAPKPHAASTPSLDHKSDQLRKLPDHPATVPNAASPDTKSSDKPGKDASIDPPAFKKP